MDTLLDLPGKIAHALFALALILAALGGRRGPPSAPSAPLVFPFMVERKVAR